MITKIDCKDSIDLFSTLSPSNSRISSPGCNVPETQATQILKWGVAIILTYRSPELRRTQLNLIETKGAIILVHHGAQLRPRVSLGYSQPSMSTFPVGGNQSTQRKPTNFGGALRDSFHISVMSPQRSQRSGKCTCSDACTTEVPYWLTWPAV